MANKVTPVIHVKDNNITSIKDIKTKVNKSNVKEIWQDEKRDCEVKAYDEAFEMDEVAEPLRSIKYSKKTKQGKYSQVLLVTTDFNIPFQILYKMMHMRWDIENSLFNKLRTYSALEHYFVHHPNAIEAILYLMSIATNLVQLFIFRRINGTDIKLLTQKNSTITRESALSSQI